MTIAGDRGRVGTVPASPAGARQPVSSWAGVWKVEIVKLAALMRVRVVFAGCLLGPVLFVAAEAVQSSVPSDTLFGRWVHESGFAVPLLVLGYADLWILPVAIGVVAGDIFSQEDRHRTWSLILTRSQSRAAIFAGKVLAAATYSVLVTLVLGASSTVSGLVAVGHQPLVGLSGTLISPGHALTAVAASWASELAPVIAVTAIACAVSVAARSSWVGVVAPVLAVLALNLVSMLSAIDPVRPLLFTSGFEAWHGLVRSGQYTDQIRASVEASIVWAAAAIALAAWLFRRRDVVDG